MSNAAATHLASSVDSELYAKRCEMLRRRYAAMSTPGAESSAARMGAMAGDAAADARVDVELAATYEAR